jgi:glycerate kinase
MRILVAPQEFKGSLTAREAAAAIARGLREALPDAGIDVLALADGGPGTVEVLVEATAGSYAEAPCHDPIGRAMLARWGVLGDGETAVIEMAAASGLAVLRPSERDPRVTSTYGTGEIVDAALDAGHRRIIVGAGGSATNDGGAGVAQALGAHLLDEGGRELPPGGEALASLARIDVSALDARLAEADITVATDVLNPLCGPDGASKLYGPQKGAAPEVAKELDAALAHYADVIEHDLGIDVRDVPGAGAAGGLGAGLIAFCHAEVRQGFEVVAEAVGLAERIARADVVITGEGRLDRQTAFGKTPEGVARAAREAGKRVIATVGSAEAGATGSFDAVYPLTDVAASFDDAIRRAGELLEGLASSVGRELAGDG